MTTKYEDIKVGDKIAFPQSLSIIKGGIISQIKGLNGHAKEVWTNNGGRFIVSKWNPNNYYVEKVGR